MKILLIFPLCPLPLNSGGQIRVWNIAKQLSKQHTIDLVCFIRKESEKEYESELKTVFNSVVFIQRKKLFDRTALITGGKSFLSFFFANISLLFSTLFSRRPLLSHLYDSDDLRFYVLAADLEQKYDLIYAETFYGISSLKNILTMLKTRTLLIDQNIESIAYDRQSRQQKNILLRMLMFVDVLKIRREEEFFWKAVSLLGALSSTDKAYIAQRTGKSVLTLENGVDITWFSEKLEQRVQNELLFVGTFSYFQNVDSLHWFLDALWPAIQKKFDQPLHLRIVGRGADAVLKQYVQSKGCHIDDSVEDIRSAFQHATVLVAPLRAGSGTKYKILEAMASHLPIITTPVGAEGLGVKSGEEILVAEDDDAFISQTVQLLRDVTLQNKLSVSAYDFVSRNYDWEQIVVNFENELKLVDARA